jgi:hypothetical protein
MYWFDDFPAAATTSGRPVPGTEFRIVDDEASDALHTGASAD